MTDGRRNPAVNSYKRFIQGFPRDRFLHSGPHPAGLSYLVTSRYPETTGLNDIVRAGSGQHGTPRDGMQPRRDLTGLFARDLATAGLPGRNAATTGLNGIFSAGCGRRGTPRAGCSHDGTSYASAAVEPAGMATGRPSGAAGPTPTDSMPAAGAAAPAGSRRCYLAKQQPRL